MFISRPQARGGGVHSRRFFFTPDPDASARDGDYIFGCEHLNRQRDMQCGQTPESASQCSSDRLLGF